VYNAILLLIFVLLANSGYAAIPEKEIQTAIGERLNKLQSETAWREYIKTNADKFPSDFKRETVLVDKSPLEVAGDSFTLGIGYRQFFMKTKMERAKKIMNSPELFKDLFGLDEDSKFGEVGEVFKARIFKKVPVLSNQDYILQYEGRTDGKIWFQRAKQAEDRKNFAIRDNLKALEEVGGGVLFREVSLVYILRWYLRAAGPQVRSIMEKEMVKLNDSVKCAAESEKPLTKELAAECWKMAESKKH
jgi:hypothetical protein